MARTGKVNDFYFDPNIFAEYMQEQYPYADAIIASGIVREDATILDTIGSKGNVGTIPLYPAAITDTALNFDGTTDNTPNAIKGKKQSFMKIGRMAAWKDADFTRYLTGVSPLENLANNLLVPYYRHTWQQTLLKTLSGVMGVTALASHVSNISITTGTIGDGNKVNESTFIELGQKALGDMAYRFNLIIMHSAIYAAYQKLNLISYNKYTIGDALKKDVNLPTLFGKIVVVDDSLVDTSTTGFPVYTSYMVGTGAILGANCSIPTPYYTDYDPETDGGINKLYTKQAKVLHPNGMSIAFDSISADSPTDTELATAANWSLAYDAKNVAIACVKSNG